MDEYKTTPCRFRQAFPADKERSWRIIEQAKEYMALSGRHQWDGDYPSMKDVESDIAKGNAYVMETDKGLTAYGAVVFTGEAAYSSIKGGWLSSLPYVVLHRLCVADEARGKGTAQRYFREVETLAAARGIRSFKVDTNYDNSEMLHILAKCGFHYCGEVWYKRGLRKAFEKLIGR